MSRELEPPMILATISEVHTVFRMGLDQMNVHLIISGCAPDGSVVVIRCPIATKLMVTFDDDNSIRDHTSWMADFAMIGWYHYAAETPAPHDGVEVAHLAFEGVELSEVEAWWILPSSGRAHGCNSEQLLQHIARGISIQIAEAVASEILDKSPVPEDPNSFSVNPNNFGSAESAEWESDGGLTRDINE